jgi:hypothetical protein
MLCIDYEGWTLILHKVRTDLSVFCPYRQEKSTWRFRKVLFSLPNLVGSTSFELVTPAV